MHQIVEDTTSYNLKSLATAHDTSVYLEIVTHRISFCVVWRGLCVPRPREWSNTKCGPSTRIRSLAKGANAPVSVLLIRTLRATRALENIRIAILLVVVLCISAPKDIVRSSVSDASSVVVLTISGIQGRFASCIERLGLHGFTATVLSHT